MATYQQEDWTGEEPVQHSLDHCPVCNCVMPFFFGVGRPMSYCSDACKMKAYRKRQKSLRNAAPQESLRKLVIDEAFRNRLSDLIKTNVIGAYRPFPMVRLGWFTSREPQLNPDILEDAVFMFRFYVGHHPWERLVRVYDCHSELLDGNKHQFKYFGSMDSQQSYIDAYAYAEHLWLMS